MGYHFRCGHIEHASELVVKHHYSGRMAGNVQYVFTWHCDGGLFGDYGDPVAACIFSIPPTRWARPVLELSRLVRTPECNEPLSGFITKCVRYLKSKGETLLVSFADFTQNHHGGVYQASSWNFSDFREPRQDGLVVNGTFVPGRSCNSRWGTRSPAALAKRLPDQTIEPHYDAGKFLYWKDLGPKGRRDAEILGLRRLPYPKPVVVPPQPKPVQASLFEASE